MTQTAIDNIEIKCDDNEQYSRRSCVRIHGLDFNSDEDNVMKKVERCYRDMAIEFNQNEIDVLIVLVNPLSIKKKKKKKVRSIIIKFRVWESITAFCKVRPRNHLDQQKKPSSNFNVSLDLNKRFYNLLTKARGLVSNNHLIQYAFTDINCSLVLDTRLSPCVD